MPSADDPVQTGAQVEDAPVQPVPDPADSGAEPDPADEVAVLRARVEELTAYRIARERADLIDGLAATYPLVPAELLRTLTGMPDEQLTVTARQLHQAMAKQGNSAWSRPGYSGGGLDPAGDSQRAATWSGAFRKAAEQRRT